MATENFCDCFRHRPHFDGKSPVTTPFIGLTCALWLALSPAAVAIEFLDVTDTAGPFPVTESWGATAVDVNGDGWTDLWHNSHRSRPYLYLNEGNGTFSDITLAADRSDTWIGDYAADQHAGTWGDFDNDGDQDLFVATGINFDAQLLVNQGGYFVDQTAYYGMLVDYEGQGAYWLDFSGDAYLDVLSSRPDGGKLFEQLPLVGFRNRTLQTGFECQRGWINLADLSADGKPDVLCAFTDGIKSVFDISPYAASNGATPFLDITSSLPLVPALTDTVTGDFDGNLQSDILGLLGVLRRNGADLVTPDRIEANFQVSAPKPYVGFDFAGGDQLRITVQSVQFNPNHILIGSAGTRAPDSVFTLDSADPSTHGLAEADPNAQSLNIGYMGGGRWEVRVYPDPLRNWRGHIIVERLSGASFSDLGYTGQSQWDLPVTPVLLLNDNGFFTDQAATRGLDQAVSCASAGVGDFDNDMDLDLYFVCQTAASNIANRLYENLGDGTFVEVAGAGGATGPVGGSSGDGVGAGDSVVVADLDADGFLDLFVTNGLNLEPVRAGGPTKLFRNVGNSNHWIELDLVAMSTSRDALGARVLVTAGGATQLREQGGGYHRWSQDDRRIHFGLGQNTLIETITVHWPSGVIDTYSDVSANALYRITEGMGGFATGSLEVVNLGPVGPLPGPGQGDECGEPVYDHEYGPALLLWRDCPGDTWHVRAKGGRIEDAVRYFGGSLQADAAFRSVVGFQLDDNDTLDIGMDDRVQFSLGVWFANDDGFDFDAAGITSLCFAPDAAVGTRVLFGAGRWPVQGALDLLSLRPCAAPAYSLDVLDISIREGGDAARFTVNLSPAPGAGESVVVSYQTQDGSAQSGSDYTTTAGTLTFTAGQTQNTVSVPIADDNTPESDENFSLQLTSANTNTVSATATILDDDSAGALPACGQPAYDEATESAVFVWNDCGSSDWHVRVTAGGQTLSYQGTLISDQGFSTMSPFSFEANDVLPPNYVMNVGNTGQDGLDFSFPTGAAVCFTLDSPSNLPVYAGSDRVLMGSAMSLPDFGACDAGGFILSAGDVTVTENAGTAVFTVNLSPAPGAGESVVVGYQTQDGSAVAGSDYTTTAGTLTYTQGQTQKTVSVPIVDDATAEGTESFSLLLTSAATSTVSASATIRDDDSGGALRRQKVYTVSPCRVVDTRGADPQLSTFSGDRLAPGETVSFYVTGNLINGQGGAASCGIPPEATGVFANVVAVRPQGSAISNYLTVYPYGESGPLASTVNYPADITALANGVLVPLCDPAAATCDYDLDVYNHTGLAVHLVIDVTGYLAAPAP